MRRNAFEDIRKRRGRLCEVGEPRECPKCGAQVQEVTTRRLPIRQYLVFDEGPRGMIHRCKAMRRTNAG